MRVLVTGGSGRVGTYTIADLLDHGHEVVATDQRRPTDDRVKGVRFIQTDLIDVGQVADAMHGCDAVIHLGAIPSPNSNPDHVVFTNNTQSTFAVLQAAALLGIKRAVYASSVSAYGTAYAPTLLFFSYAPVDEDHPMRNQDPYGLSKEVDEQTAAMFHRRTGMQVVGLRFHWVALPEELAGLRPNGWTEPAEMAKILWGYVDARDAATACRLGIETGEIGCEAFNIVADDTLSTIPTTQLLTDHIPDLEIRQPIEGTASAFSTQKARRLLNWHPRYSWRTPD